MSSNTRKKPMCKSCCTPMKGHLRGQCRPNCWCDHGDNHKLHGGHYEWETQQWTGSKWVPLVVTTVNENQVVVNGGDSSVIVPIDQIMQAPPPGACPERDAFLAEIEQADESETDSDMPDLESIPDDEINDTPCPEEPEDEWKPLTDQAMWDYYQTWQQNSAFVPFPTRVGMTSAQLGDIMENYAKYRDYYN